MKAKQADAKAQVKIALQIVLAIAETIRELGTIPSGTLYAQLTGRMDLETYQGAVGTLVRAGLVQQNPGHVLEWIGPKK